MENNSDQHTALAYRSEQVRGLYLGQSSVLFANLVVAIIFAGLHYRNSGQWLHVSWVIGLALVLIGRHLNFVRYVRRGFAVPELTLSAEDSLRELRFFRIGVFGSAVCWGVGGYLLMQVNDVMLLAYTILAIGGMCAGSINALALDRVSGLIFLIFTPLPSLVALAIHQTPGIWSLALFLIVGIVFVGIISRKTSAWVGELIRLRLDSQHQSEELKTSQERFKFALEGAQQAAWDFDVAEQRELYTERWPLMLGYESNTAIRPLVHPEDIDLFETAFAALQNGETTQLDVEYRCQHRNGHWVWVHSRGTAIAFDRNNRPSRLSGTREDISANKQLQEQWNNAEKLRSIGQLAGGVAHDFNNNLTAMTINVDLLGMQVHTPEAKQSVQELSEMIQRAASTTQQLLLFARKTTINSESVELNTRIDGLLRVMSRLLGESIQLKFDEHAAQIYVNADAALLDQAIINLAINARDAMPGGGQLAISIRDEMLDSDAIKLRAPRSEQAEPGHYAVIEVKDNGQGIEPELLGRIFEPFYTTKEVGKGTGLGLASVHGMAEQHRGFITVHSTLKLGSCFSVFLPLLEIKAKAQPIPLEPRMEKTAPAVIRSGRVLLVEDESMVRDSLERMLKHLKYEVVSAASATEGAACWRECNGQFDVVLSDLVMPGPRNGLDMVLEFRRQKPGVKAVLMSGYSPESLTKETNDALQANQLLFLPKPFNLKTLSATLNTLMERRSVVVNFNANANLS
jgi:two-component system, cell cycle sensor histidine kinase and response regulator CckA